MFVVILVWFKAQNSLLRKQMGKILKKTKAAEKVGGRSIHETVKFACEQNQSERAVSLSCLIQFGPLHVLIDE